MKRFKFPLRTIHLDFHTGPDIPDVGRDFDAEEFALTFVKANVDSVTVFAKCHHGRLYYDTESPARHPGLPRRLDLLGEQVEALHRHGVRAPIYISVQVDEFAANQHPDWCAVDADGRRVKHGGPFTASWHTLDMSSPYQDYLAGQVAEVLSRFAPVDGLFLDMCWDQPSCSKWAIDKMRKRGYEPTDAGDRQLYAREVVYEYMRRFKRMVDQANKGHAPAGVWFNSRPKTNLSVEKKYLRHIEVECLPTGGWGYAYFPYVASFVRPLGLPTLSHTGRFHKSWGDFGGLKPESALRYECCSILSQGMTQGVGDQMHPRGTLDKAAYERIGKVYGYIKRCEPWVAGGKLVSQIAVMVDPKLGDRPKADGLGLVRMLQQLRHQFDLLPPDAELDGYELVIITDSVRVDDVLKRKLRLYLQQGGALMVSGNAAVDGDGKPVMKELGIRTHGQSPFTVTYLRAGRAIGRGLPPTDHVMYEQGFQMTPAKGAESLCRIVEPYFERSYEHFCSHNQTPPAKLSRYSAAVQKGRAITFATPVFKAYGRHASVAYRDIVSRCIGRLLPEPLIRDDGPAHLEATVVKRGRRTVVHLLSFCREKRTDALEIIEDAVPLVDMTLSVRLSKRPKRALLAPEERELPFTYANGRAEVSVTTKAGHAMVVFE